MYLTLGFRQILMENRLDDRSILKLVSVFPNKVWLENVGFQLFFQLISFHISCYFIFFFFFSIEAFTEFHKNNE